ncbi:hypothetical protein QVA66_06095 [Staphylococcus chromogenes]|nr:hypothetical protein [Staphylococcus chromogenes]
MQKLTELAREGTPRSWVIALVGGLFLFSHLTLQTLINTSLISPSMTLVCRGISSTLYVVAIVSFFLFWRMRKPVIALLFLAFGVIGTICYQFEVVTQYQDVQNFATADLPRRYSQVILPTAVALEGLLCWKDRRIPSLLGVFFWLYAASWYLLFWSNGVVFLQINFAFLSDAFAFLAEGGLCLWMLLLGLSRMR